MTHGVGEVEAWDWKLSVSHKREGKLESLSELFQLAQNLFNLINLITTNLILICQLSHK
jgi:hypothetical protein